MLFDISDPQIVQILISSSAVSEGAEQSSITLTCEATDGNPRNFTSVRWHRNNELANETSEPVLHIKYATRIHNGNYSCEGLNAAGWSNPSKAEALIVHCKKTLNLHYTYPVLYLC